MGALKELIKVIETIQQRINEYGNSVRKAETRTRQVLIDPLLTALGWDVTDPALVTLEYDAGNGKADYALLGANRPVAVVEAKRLQQHLHDKHTDQVLNYANRHGIKYMAVTNGDEWIMYDVFKNVPLQDRVLMQLKISEAPPHESAIQSLRLWNPNLSSDTGPVAPVDPVIISGDPQPDRIAKKPPITPSGNHRWIALNDAKLQTKWQKTGRKGSIFIRFNGGLEILARSWADVLKKTVDALLVEPGRLTPAHCPRYHLGRSKHSYFLNNKPVHENGNPFRNKRELSNGMWLNVNLTLRTMIANLCGLLEELDVDPASVKISLQAKSKVMQRV